MSNPITRREMLGITASAAATVSGLHWIYARDDAGNIVVAATNEASDWKPIFLSRNQAESVAAICDAIIPRTDTPGARDARVHEFIDLQLSGEGERQQGSFVEGLEWFDKHCKKVTRKKVADASPEQLAEALETISDVHESLPDDMNVGANFFGNIKRRTIFGFYTSKEGFVEDLGYPEHHSLNATFEGCQGDDH